ncbi:MAG: hypothetical protein WD278_02910 [Pirellulales bacterium]
MLKLLLFAGCALFGQIEAPAGEDLAPEVRKLVRQLDAPEKALRDEAEQKLIELGVAALSLLPETTDRTPAEVALRLERIRSRLERTQAEAAVNGSTVSLEGSGLSLAEVFEAIEKQTGNKLVDFREQFNQEPAPLKLALDVENMLFWQALDQVLDQANLTIYSYGAEEGLAVVGRSNSQLPRFGRANYAGSFRIEATEFSAHRDLRDPNSHTMQLGIEAAWEPRLKPVVIIQPAGAIEAMTDAGEPLPIAGGDTEMEISVSPGATSADLFVNFELPDRGVKRIASLKGKLSVVLPGRIETFRFGNLEKAKKVERRKAGVTVVLDEARKNNEVWEVRVRVVFDKASGALESHRGWIFNNEAYLEAPNKETIASGSLETTRQTETDVGIAYLFDVPDGLKGYTFVYRTPAAIVTVPIEYELKDLELP